MATFLQICQSVRAQAGISGDGPTNVIEQVGIYAEVVRWVEESYNEIQSMFQNWNFLFTEVSFLLQTGFQDYPASATHSIRQFNKQSFLIQYQLGNKERLPYIPYAAWAANNTYLETKTGKPEVVTELPTGELRFWPTPDEDYTIYFTGYSTPDIMTASDDTPIFPAQYTELIKLRALMRYAEYYNSQEVYQSAEATFNRMIKDMKFAELPRDSFITPTFVPFA